jgi:hypothetical protein
MLSKKILVNGCGLTFGNSNVKSWPKILSAVGVDVVNLSAPAVSNQWIMDRTAEYLFNDTDIDAVIVQLTNINKLDVQIDDQRFKELVESDSLRNFVWHGVWPSSSSNEHISKQLYYQHLYSPELLTKELAIKCKMLEFWCRQHSIELYVYQGYAIPWTDSDLKLIEILIKNIELPWGDEYVTGEFYKFHNFESKNTVPCIEYFFHRAKDLANTLNLPVLDKLEILINAYNQTSKNKSGK